MYQKDTHKLLGMIYVLILLFLGVLYFQPELLSDQKSQDTLREVYQASTGSSALLGQSFHISGDAILIIIVATTLVFGFALRLERSRF